LHYSLLTQNSASSSTVPWQLGFLPT
jgi:hypothetical protein